MVVAGRDFLKILRIDGNDISEATNLRGGPTKRTTWPHEVKWGTALMKDTIAAAGSNGLVCVYKDGKLERQLSEHTRLINRLAFNPNEGRLLLSGSADGTIKLWDLRGDKRSRATFLGNAEQVRDIQFNPLNTYEFAAGFDNGAVLRWDTRRPDYCERRISAHNGPCLSIDWHPDGRHIASAGRDKMVKVWDFNITDTRKNAKHSIHTAWPIAGVAWRPVGARILTTELATCFHRENCIQVWDLRRPYIPTKQIDSHDGAVTGIVWKEEDLLWSVGRDGKFFQSDLLHARQPIDRLSHVAIGWSADNEFAFAATPRPKPKQHVQTPEPDEDVFYRERRHSRAGSFKALRPPSQLNLLHLDTLPGTYQPTQHAAIMWWPEKYFDSEAFEFFANNYKVYVPPEERISDAFEYNACVAEHLNYHQDAHTWRMLAYAISIEEEEAEKIKQKREREEALRIQKELHEKRKAHLTVARSISNPSTRTTPLTRPVPDTPRAYTTQNVSDLKQYSTLQYDPLSLPPPSRFAPSLSSSTGSTTGPHSHSRPPTPPPRIASPQPPSPEFNVFPHSSRPMPIRNKKSPLSSLEPPPHHSLNSGQYGTGLEFGSSSYDEKPLVRDSDDEGSPEFGRSHGDTTVGLDSISEEERAHSPPLVGSASQQAPLGIPPKIIPISPKPHEKGVIPGIHHPAAGRLLLRDPPPDEPQPWDAALLIHKTLEFYVLGGELQFAATLVSLIARVVDLDYNQADDLLMSYIELLHRHSLFLPAAYLSKYAPTASPRAAVINNTSVPLSCGHCLKPMLNESGRGFWFCESCRRVQDGCAICRAPVVESRWTFCHECGHGGHDVCLEEWFVDEERRLRRTGGDADEVVCPVGGCGHVCGAC